MVLRDWPCKRLEFLLISVEVMPKSKTTKKAGTRLKHESFTEQLKKSRNDTIPVKVGRKSKGRSEDDEDEADASYDVDMMDAEEED